MKMAEIEGGLRIPLNNEEVSLVEKVKKHNGCVVHKLNEREREVSIGLIRKNVLNIQEGKVTYNKIQSYEDAVW